PPKLPPRDNGDLEAVLTDETGKVLKNLPDPRQDDDAELAKAARASYSAAKKELKKFAGMQTTRLYEAMCTQRTWSAADWRTFLMGHPLLKFLCQRLVWAVWERGGQSSENGGDGTSGAGSEPVPTKTFRPLDDG